MIVENDRLRRRRFHGGSHSLLKSEMSTLPKREFCQKHSVTQMRFDNVLKAITPTHTFNVFVFFFYLMVDCILKVTGGAPVDV